METWRQRKASKSAAVYIPISALAIVFLTIMGLSSFLRVVDIEVIGVSRYSVNEIIMVSGISPGDGLLFLDTEAAENRIIAAMPFVRNASITRNMPDGIVIEITESSPIAYVESYDEFFIIDSNGRLLERRARADSSLIEIRGLNPLEVSDGDMLRAQQGEETELRYVRDILAAFEREDIYSEVSYLDVSHITQTYFRYMGRFNVILGEPSVIEGVPGDLNHKLSLLDGAVEKVNNDFGITGVARINISSPSSGVVINARAQ